MVTCIIDRYNSNFFQFEKSGNILHTLEKQFPIISRRQSLLLDVSQIDVEFLVQTERNKKKHLEE